MAFHRIKNLRPVKRPRPEQAKEATRGESVRQPATAMLAFAGIMAEPEPIVPSAI